MTHDELLERLDELKWDVGDSGINEESKAIYALRAVVELHSPFDGYCQRCTVNNWGELRQTYPCDEIQAIKKELQ